MQIWPNNPLVYFINGENVLEAGDWKLKFGKSFEMLQLN